MDNGQGLAYSSIADFQVNELKKGDGIFSKEQTLTRFLLIIVQVMKQENFKY